METDIAKHCVASEADLEPGSLKRVAVGDTAVCLARTESGDWFAIADTCSHEEYSLSQGDLWGQEVECPMHGSRFDLATGQPDQLPATEPVKTYPVVIEAGQVYVGDDETKESV
jgi:3-phenylpropionate/trans-cinnamate dioxygenase ferredoxin subunit